jgi:hypothetical protein
MTSLLSLGFEYKGTHQSFLARVKEVNGKTEYHITLMNGHLGKQLYGNYILTGNNGKVSIEASGVDEEQGLRRHIATALNAYLHEKSLTNY